MSAAAKLAAAAAKAAKAAPAAAPAAAHVPASSAPPQATSVATSVAPPQAAPKTATAPASKATSKPKSLECAEFSKTKQHCHRGEHCRDKRCVAAYRAAVATAPPKSSGNGGDGGVAAALAAMEARVNSRLDNIAATVTSGFTETKSILSEQQKATIGMTKALEAMMIASANFQSSVTGLLKGGMASHPELPAPPTRPAICAPATTPRSKITEVHDERPSARGGGCATEFGRSSDLTGADIDPFLVACGSVFPQDGTLFRALCEICGKTGLSDYHRELISSIRKVTNNDNLAALLFLLLTGSKQFRKGSFSDFRTSCDAMLGSNWTKTQTAFSQVCDHMLKGMSDWQITKKGGISVSNADLQNKSNRTSVFNNLVTNFQS